MDVVGYFMAPAATAFDCVGTVVSTYNLNANSTDCLFCAWQNTTSSAQATFGDNMCCRAPGR